MSARNRHLFRASLVLLGIVFLSSAFAGVEKRKIVPGPARQSALEAAIQADPAAGIEHAVILLEETERDDDREDWLVRYHLRAKILSNEARELGNVKIRFLNYRSSLREWWGRVILPNGTVKELAKADLKQETVVSVGGYEVRAWVAALPGIEPGAVIDYGYVLQSSINLAGDAVPIQREYPVRDFYYRWTPYRNMVASYLVTHSEGLPIRREKDDRAVVVLASNLAGVKKEPMMPASLETRATGFFYYVDQEVDNAGAYWKETAAATEREQRRFADKGAIRKLIAELALAPDADLKTKLTAAYDWMNQNVANLDRMSSEEKAKRAGNKEDERRVEVTASKVLEQRAGHTEDLVRLFTAIARELGAEAHLVMVTDRTERYFNPALLSRSQFERTLVAARAPGTPDDQAFVVAPGSGLPFDQVPWWMTGVGGFLVEAANPRVFPIPTDTAAVNTSSTLVQLRFAEGDEAASVEWARQSTGQSGYSRRHELRIADAAERGRKLKELCGADERFEVSRAEAPELQVFAQGLRVECQGTLTVEPPDEQETAWRVRLDGPWIESLPDIGSAPRVHPVIFDYNRVTRTTTLVTPPPGYNLNGALQPAKIDSPFGRYVRSVQVNGQSLQVQRTLHLVRVKVEPEEFEALQKFFADIRRADAMPLVLRPAAAAAAAK